MEKVLINPTQNTQMDKSIKKIYVVGFPKSGNTWLVRLLADSLCVLIGGKDENEEIEEFNREIKKRNSSPEFQIIKSHALPEDFFSDKKQSIYGIVYTQRDFRDVIVSAFFHTYRSIDKNKVKLRSIMDLILSNPLETLKYIAYRALFWKKLIFLTRKGWGGNMGWHEHIDKWRAAEGEYPRIHTSFTRYESLKEDVINSLKKILDDLNLEVKSGMLDEAVRRQSFKNKKAYFQQKYQETGEQKYQNMYSFMRKGETGDWINYFSPAMTFYLLKISHE